MLLQKIKSIVKLWLPPAIVMLVQRLHHKGLYFEGNFSSWESAAKKCSGYSSVHILNKVLNATLAVKNGEAAYERDSVIFDEIDYVWPVLTGLMLAATHNNGRLNVLDFGGALGSTYFQNRKFLLTLPELSWNVVEQPHYANVGKKYISDQHLKFYSTVDECLIENAPNIILLSGVLQYIEHPESLIEQLSSIEAKYLIIDRTPFSFYESDHLVIQHVPTSIYAASYPMWIFSRNKFNAILAKNWNMIARNLGADGSFKSDKNIAFSFEGILLEASND